MKRIVYLIALLCSCLGAWAQDYPTEEAYFEHRVPYYYYGTFWADQLNIGPEGDMIGIGISYGNTTWGRKRDRILMKKMITPTPLPVKGIAIVYYTLGRDTSCVKFKPEHLMIYKHFGDQMEKLADAEWTIDMKARYYFNALQGTSPGNVGQELFYWRFPMWEVYFDKTIIVEDSFYVGTTKANEGGVENVADLWNDSCQRETRWTDANLVPISQSVGYNRAPQEPNFMPIPEWMWRREFGADTSWHMEKDYGLFLCCFPIIDTTMLSAPTDQVLPDQEVTLSPNPAKDMALLSSNLMMRDVEVFDADGRLVVRKLVNGLRMPLYTKGWNKGLYLVLVHTIGGTTVKKLIVQ